MVELFNNNVVNLIPKLFSIDIKNEDFSEFFDIAKSVLNYKYYYLFLLNSDDIELKYTNTKYCSFYV